MKKRVNISLFFLTLFLITFFCSGQNKNEDTRANLKNLSPDERIEVLKRLAETFATDSIELSLDYLILAYEAAIKTENIETIIAQAEKVAETYSKLGKYDLAIKYFNISLSYAKELPDTKHFSRIYRLIGNSYFYLGEYDKCLGFLMESLRYAELNKDEGGIAGAYNNIGLINLNSEKYDEALENFSKAEKMFFKIGNIDNQGTAILNIGNIYYYKKEFDKALDYFQRALTLFENISESKNIALAAQNIAVIYDEKNDFENSIKYSEKALNLFIKNNDVYGIASLSCNIGYLYLRNSKIEQAEEYLKMSLSYAKQTNSLPLLLNTYQVLTDLYESKGDFENAFKQLKLEYQLADSISRMETTEKLAELEVQYQVDQKDKENKLMRRFVIYISILSFLILFALLFSYRVKVRSNRQLRDKNSEIEIQNAKLEEINATKNKFFSIIAHDLKNPLAAFIGFMEVILERIDEMPREELQGNLKQLSILAESMLDLLENLLKWGRSQAGVLAFKPTTFSLYQLFEEVLKVVSLNAQTKEISIKIEKSEEIIITADRNMLSTVLRNLLSNAIKFTPRGGNVVLTATSNFENVITLVNDNGIGISEEDQQKLFHIDSKFRNPGTERESGSGIGLILCKEFIERHGGSMIVESKLNLGSTFGFSIPIPK